MLRGSVEVIRSEREEGAESDGGSSGVEARSGIRFLRLLHVDSAPAEILSSPVVANCAVVDLVLVHVHGCPFPVRVLGHHLLLELIELSVRDGLDGFEDSPQNALSAGWLSHGAFVGPVVTNVKA